jgi:hypothetical protein
MEFLLLELLDLQLLLNNIHRHIDVVKGYFRFYDLERFDLSVRVFVKDCYSIPCVETLDIAISGFESERFIFIVVSLRLLLKFKVNVRISLTHFNVILLRLH